MVFSTLCFLQLGNVLAIRSERDSFFRHPLSNPALLAAVAATVALQMVTIYVPVLNPIFKTIPLKADELAIVLGLSTSLFFAVEIEKLVRRILARRKPAAP
jgi:Ca2+-transporting ATPase